MRDLSARLPCPACLGTTMDKVAVGERGLWIDRCARCGGVWLEHGEVQRLRAASGKRRPEWATSPGPRFQMRCHDCHALMDRATEACAACGWNNILCCPSCDQPMRMEEHAGIRLDVCRACRGVWFDHHELKAIWGPSFDTALRKRSRSRRELLSRGVDDAGDVLFGAIFYAPELAYLGARAVGGVAMASAEVVSRLPAALASTPDAASTLFEAAGDAAGAVFGVVVDIIGGIFDAF
jgi:Zn-finger nucleic acid-binding protein